MLLLIIAGISVGAGVVEWWNRSRITEVEEEVRELESKRERILAAEQKERVRLLRGYLGSLRTLVEKEHSFRTEVRSELGRAMTQARAGLSKPFGGLDRSFFVRVVSELEQAHAQLSAEEAHLESVASWLRELADDPHEVPDPARLALPADFPREGALVQLSGQRHLHSYRLELDAADPAAGDLYALYRVNHRERRARACPVRGQLLSAALKDGGGELTATVEAQHARGVLLDFHGVRLLLPGEGQRIGRYKPGERITIHAGAWLLSDVLRATTKDRPLEVSTRQRTSGTREVWSPLALRVPSRLRTKFLEAAAQLAKEGNEEKPWRISLGHGARDFLFSLGAVGLSVRADMASASFELTGTMQREARPPVSVRLYAALHVCWEGETKAAGDPRLFRQFLEALDAELTSQKRRMIERQGAWELRRLSLLYQDQSEGLARRASASLLPIRLEPFKDVVKVDAVVATHPLPKWLLGEEGAQGREPKVRLASASQVYPVRGFERLNKVTNTFRFTLSRDGLRNVGELLEVCRVEDTQEGIQQQRLSRTLEEAILGRFTSPGVRHHLLRSGTEKVRHVLEGTDAVLQGALRAEDVFAVWGPPGAGKTTFIVELIRHTLQGASHRRGAAPKVLVTAPTHVAVNEVLERLCKEVPSAEKSVVRYVPDVDAVSGRLKEREHIRLLDNYLREVEDAARAGGPGVEWNALVQSHEGRQALARWLFSGQSVHSATCVGMARRDFGLTEREFDLVVIDEAGKAFGAELFIPALRARKLVLVGDHKQLPPTLTAELLDEGLGYRFDLDEVESMLQRSFFKELFDSLPASSKGMLSTQYRMHPEIGRVVSQLFYDGKLASGRTGGFNTWLRSRVAFIDFSDSKDYCGRVGPDGLSHRNLKEAREAVRLLSKLREFHGHLPRTLVICPYRAQRHEVERLLAQSLRGAPVEATTVDAVQGGEAELVLLLMTRTSGRSQFVLDEHRLNVALSRAKEGIVIFGHGNYLTSSVGGPIHRLFSLDDGKAVARIRVPSNGCVPLEPILPTTPWVSTGTALPQEEQARAEERLMLKK